MRTNILLLVAAVLISAPVSAQPLKTWGQIKSLYRTADVSDQDVARAAGILRQDEPSPSDLEWMESMNETTRRQVLARLPKAAAGMSLHQQFNKPPLEPSAASGYWQYEFIEMQNGSGAGCRPNGFWNSAGGQCGSDWPPDKVYSFPCSNQSGKSRLRIWSTSWQVRWALGNGVSARVYGDRIEICVGYWSLYGTGTNPYSLLNNTYVYWN